MSHIQRFGAPLLNRAVSAARRIWFRLVTRDIDRHGTIIEPSGVDTTAFKANPVFLWMHQSGGEGLPEQPPPDVVIGRVTNIDQTYDHLDIEVEFDDDGEDGLATTCYRKVLKGFIRMVSIGCNPTSEAVTAVNGRDVLTYPTSELLECSLVIIGSNRSAAKLDRAAVAAVLRGLDDHAAEPTKHVSTVAVVANDRMLWGRRRDDDKWTTPGGHAKQDEAPLACAVRELAEEAGLTLPPKRFLHLGDVTTDRGTVVHVYRVNLSEVAGAVATKDPDKEIAEWCWVQLKEGRLPDGVLGNLHVPRNAIVAALRLDRAVAGASGPAVDFLLSAAVDQPEQRGSKFLGDGIDDDDDEVDFDMYDDDDDSDGIVVKAAAASQQRVIDGPVRPLEEYAVPHALLFKAPPYTAETASRWAAEHGYSAMPTYNFGDGYATDGICFQGNVFLVEQRDRSLFKPGAMSEGNTFITYGMPGGLGDISVVEGYLKTQRIHRGVVAHKSFPVVEGTWDAVAAVDRWRKWASSDGSGDKEKIDWGKYAEMFLWFDSKDPENFASYKFPHHDIRDNKPVTVWQGVVAAAARLNQAKGIPAADIQKMRQHLAAHYKEFDKQPPWQRVEKDFVGGLAAAWQRICKSVAAKPEAAARAIVPTATPTPAKTYLPQSIVAATDAVKDGPVHTPVDAEGAPYILATTTVQALLFPKSKFTVADAVVWAKDHGYIATGPAQEEGDFVKLVQLPENIFLSSGLGRGKKFAVVVYPSGICCVVGVIKPEGMRYLTAPTARASKATLKTATALLRGLVDARLSPSVRAEIAYGAAKATPEDAAKARRRLDKNVWSAAMLGRAVDVAALSSVQRLLHGGDAGAKAARSLLDQAQFALRFIALRDASAHADLSTITALLTNLSA